MTELCHRMCLTPTRNEAWVIKQFLAAASHWASHIIVADQDSCDGTLQQLQGVAKVHLTRNMGATYDEGHRQCLLIDRARKVPGKRILIALDADEALSANCLNSAEWERIAEAEPGTVLRFRWVNILPGFKKAWIPCGHIPFGFVDDESEHRPTRIHSRRLPWPENAAVIDCQDIVVLHFQYVLWERMHSKHRWYQAWEHLNNPQKGALQIFREYHHMFGSWEEKEIHPVLPEWLAGYDLAGVDFRSLKCEPMTWWDNELLDMLVKHGPAHFRKVDIWDMDWNALGRTVGKDQAELGDPRSLVEKLIHYLLVKTQRQRMRFDVRALERLLRHIGW